MQAPFNSDTDVELAPTRIKRDSATADVREKGLTINPILDDETAQREDSPERQDGSPNDDAIERIESQRIEEERSIAGLRDDWHMELSGDRSSAMVRLILLFSGVAPPPSWHSPWMLCRIGWPLLIIFATVFQIVFMVASIQDGAFSLVCSTVGAALLACIAALGCYWWLWPQAHRLIAQETPLPPEQLKDVIRMSGTFIVIWLLIGVGMYAWTTATGQLGTFFIFDAIPIFFFDWTLIIPLVPALGAMLLVLGMETAHAINTTKGLLQAAENKTLTRSMYTTARDRIYGRSRSWKWSLGVLAAVALYNTIALIIVLHTPSIDANFSNRFQEDIWHVCFLGKETALLFLILVLVVRVNNYADAITTVLNKESWGAPGSKEEVVRLDLLHLTTVNSITPEAAGSMWKSITTATHRPISFRVCGIRPARDVFLAALISLVGSVAGSLLRSYTHV